MSDIATVSVTREIGGNAITAIVRIPREMSEMIGTDKETPALRKMYDEDVSWAFRSANPPPA